VKHLPPSPSFRRKRKSRASVDGRPLRLDRFLPYRLSILASKVTARLAREYEQAIGLQLPEARVMTVLGAHRPVSSNAIVQHTSMDKATVSRAVARLLRLGLLTRKPDPRDRRLLVLDFTLKGRRAYAKLARLARAWESWFAAGLRGVEYERLVAVLAKLESRLDRAPQPSFGPKPRQAPARKTASRPAIRA
jgi:DNA-binding MarR family transcriptional regulator